MTHRLEPRTVALVIPLMLSACAEADGLRQANALNGTSPTATPTVQPISTPTPGPSPFTINGTGEQASEHFLLAGGPTVFRMRNENTESGPFIVTLLNGQGSHVSLLAIGSGLSYSKHQLTSLAKGEYLFNVSSAGTWSIRVEQPRLSEAVPFESLAGTGRNIFGPYRIPSGLKTFSAGQNAKGVAFKLRNEQGLSYFSMSLLVSQATASTATGLSGGFYWVDVDADDKTDWSLNLMDP